MYHLKPVKQMAKYIFAFIHLIVLFSIIWFFIGHIWILGKVNVYDNGKLCKTNVGKFSVMILIFEYIFGIWYLSVRIWNSPSALQWLQKTIQHRLGMKILRANNFTILDKSANIFFCL